MPTRLVHLVVDAADPARLARFWAGALGGDLATESTRHQAAEVERLLALGAAPIDIGQGNVPWTVLADPEGNEFCVLDPRPVYRDTGPVAAVVADCADPAAVAGFWALATGWKPAGSTDTGVSLRSPEGLGPYLELLPS